ncbi:MAG: phospho-N-acetylmuramoyl-pentapeptide-transferase [Clostridiaceae bacterium]|nr:phospho-N-acetylmuramoyl-pentapeptide-transferase [Clostridiaceae bacterium]
MLIYELIIAGAAVMVLTVIAGLLFLPKLRRAGFSKQERRSGPPSHLTKDGTPTAGGIFFAPLLALALLIPAFWQTGELRRTFVGLGLLTLLFGLIGAWDDYVKVRVNGKGLNFRTKTLASLAVGLLFAIWFIADSERLYIVLPFMYNPIAITGAWVYVYGLFIVLYLYYFINAVNLTDGVDGLLSTVSTVFALTLIITLRRIDLPGVLGQRQGASEWAMAVLVGAALGFLVFNRHPAKVFMGDWGSLSMGAIIAGVPLILGVPWVMLVGGFLFFFEALSVILQVGYFKLTGGKRIFPMTPIHHSFELKGWSENKIVFWFSVFVALSQAVNFWFLVPWLK